MSSQVILFVEDEILIRVLLTDALRDAGYDVVEASNGEEGVALLRSGKAFDLLITDVNMPGSVDGLSLVEQWQAHNPSRPALISSGHLTRDQLPAGAELISKPYSNSALLVIVERLIGPPCQNQAPKLTA